MCATARVLHIELYNSRRKETANLKKEEHSITMDWDKLFRGYKDYGTERSE